MEKYFHSMCKVFHIEILLLTAKAQTLGLPQAEKKSIF